MSDGSCFRNLLLVDGSCHSLLIGVKNCFQFTVSSIHDIYLYFIFHANLTAPLDLKRFALNQSCTMYVTHIP
jgi:hypothetical protein